MLPEEQSQEGQGSRKVLPLPLPLGSGLRVSNLRLHSGQWAETVGTGTRVTGLGSACLLTGGEILPSLALGLPLCQMECPPIGVFAPHIRCVREGKEA